METKQSIDGVEWKNTKIDESIGKCRKDGIEMRRTIEKSSVGPRGRGAKAPRGAKQTVEVVQCNLGLETKDGDRVFKIASKFGGIKKIVCSK